jgi:hypothetical protein
MIGNVLRATHKRNELSISGAQDRQWQGGLGPLARDDREGGRGSAGESARGGGSIVETRKGVAREYAGNPLTFLVRPRGFEPAAYGFVV